MSLIIHQNILGKEYIAADLHQLKLKQLKQLKLKGFVVFSKTITKTKMFS